MYVEIDWSLREHGVPFPLAAEITGTSQVFVTQSYRRGELGPAPQVGAQLATIPLYHVASLFAVQEAVQQGIAGSAVAEVLSSLSGAIFVRFALVELTEGRCQQRAGTPTLNRILWTALRSEGGKRMLESKLPVAGLETKRFAFFKDDGVTFADTLDGNAGGKNIDTWELAARMKRGLPHPQFYTHIA